MNNDQELRNQLVRMLTIRQAHMEFEDAVADFPAKHINTRLPNGDYTFWHLLEHMRFCQHDILDYIQADNYRWPKFPDDLWPDKSAETDLTDWQQTIERFSPTGKNWSTSSTTRRLTCLRPYPTAANTGTTLISKTSPHCAEMAKTDALSSASKIDTT
jgi:hypothetical protein